jgi:hypothetical protein
MLRMKKLEYRFSAAIKYVSLKVTSTTGDGVLGIIKVRIMSVFC